MPETIGSSSLSPADADALRRRLAASFASGGADYDRLRPGYPTEAVDWLVGDTAPGARVADIGAGTGKLTTALVERGFEVVAVDPSADMLDQLRARLPGVSTQLGTGESTGLDQGSVALTTFAQSWHWVDVPAGTAELARVLPVGGAVAMAWNFLDVRVDWVARLADIWHTLATRESIDANRHTPELGSGFGPVQAVTVDWEQPCSVDELAALVTTRSYYLSASAGEQQTIRESAASYLQQTFGDQDQVALPYRTHCYRVRRIQPPATARAPPDRWC